MRHLANLLPPLYTSTPDFASFTADEVVPFLNQESMERHLVANGYDSFDIDDTSTERHTDTGTYYVLKAAVLLDSFVPTGMDFGKGHYPFLPVEFDARRGEITFVVNLSWLVHHVTNV